MQQKLEAELMSLAHGILKIKKGEDIKLLTEKAKDVYERLAVLSFIERYSLETPQNTKSVDQLIEEIFSIPTETEPTAEEKENREALSKAFDPIEEDEPETIEPEQPVFEEIALQEQNIEELADAFEPIKTETTDDIQTVEKEVESDKEEIIIEEKIDAILEEEPTSLQTELPDLKSSLEKEFDTSISLEETTDLFENAQRITPKKTLNDVAMQKQGLQIDLNDRIAFVKHLFENSHEDFNRVISQLNSMESEKEAVSFLKMIKKEYHWGGKEVYEERLFLLVERKFN